MNSSLDLVDELQKIYDSEINVRISWLWDCGIDVWLGDEVNGYIAEETVAAASEIAPWLQEAVAHFYPTSTYAASLSPEVRERAAIRRFLPPRIAARVNCPHCGSPNGGDRDGGTVRLRVLGVAIRSRSNHPRFNNPIRMRASVRQCLIL